MKDENPDVHMNVYLDMESISWDIRKSLTRDQAIKFCLLVDAQYADLDFTQRLYAALGDVIREELGADGDQSAGV